MALDTFAPAMQPVLGLMRSVDGRTLETGFGDGFSQSAPDGLNPVQGKWSPNWPAVPNEVADYIDDFFESHLGKTFLWTPPARAVTYKVRCKTWSRTQVTDQHDGISATFQEVASFEE